ncbi:MAG: hypothetical protein KDC66_23615 [Phaeodactylibacter sp.]|nr:hypothetical protein [Phaeodactylibacter sp.]MCB9272460.1 hypothetical protein [Lewinellaceae bacterium]
MSQNPTYRFLASLGLLLFFLLPMSMKEVHLYWEHQHSPVCDAKAGDHHLHGPEYQYHDCTLCLIQYTQFLGAEQIEARLSLLPEKEEAPRIFHLPYQHPTLSHIRERGPPCSANCYPA